MKYKSVFAILLLCLGCCEVAAADANSEVTTALREFYRALNRADGGAAAAYLLPKGDSFPRSGGPLDPEADTPEQSAKNLRASFAAGLRFHVTLRELRVTTYGDAALATFYTDGSTTGVNRVTSQGAYRATYFFVKRPGGWKIAHFHISPLLSPHPPV